MTEQDSRKVWLVTGCTSGLGRATAQTLLAHGYRVVIGVLSATDADDLVAEYPHTAKAVALDVTNPVQVQAAVEVAEREFGGVHVLLNNAGFGFVGAIEEGERGEFMPMIEVNLLGTLSMMRAVLPGMRRRRRGHIMSVSSVGGFSASAGFGVYSATKFGVEALSEALAVEVATLGIKVTVVEPGQLRTNFRGESMKMAGTVVDDYADTVGNTRGFIAETHGSQPGDPRKAAEVMIAVAEADEPPLPASSGVGRVPPHPQQAGRRREGHLTLRAHRDGDQLRGSRDEGSRLSRSTPDTYRSQVSHISDYPHPVIGISIFTGPGTALNCSDPETRIHDTPQTPSHPQSNCRNRLECPPGPAGHRP